MSTDKKEKVGPGKFVAYAYKLYNEADGSLLFEAPADAPDVMIYGVSQDIIPGLLAAMKDLSAGDRFGVTLPPAAAFGDRHDENIIELDKEVFMRDGELVEEVKVGADLPMLTQEGFRVLGRVVEIGPHKVRMDFNHPFAGLTVRYDGEIIEVRDATEDELHPSHGCGGCGGGCGEGNCGSGCSTNDKEGCCGSCH